MNIKIKPHIIALFIVFSMCANYYFLIDNETNILGIQASQLAVGIALFWGMFVWAKMIKRPNKRFLYDKLILIFPIFAFLSAYQANRLYGQSVFMGFFGQYFNISWALLYYLLSKYLYYGEVTVDDLKKLVKVIGTIELIVYISQYFLTDIVRFTYANEGMRYGDVRFYYSTALLDLLLFMEFDNILKDGKKLFSPDKIISVIYIVAILFDTMVVQKYRLTSIGLIICLGMGVIIVKKSIGKKSTYFLLAIIAGLILLNTTLVQDVLNEILHGQTYTGRASTMSIRKVGRALYIDTFIKHPFLGGGFPRSDYAAAAEFSGLNSRIYLSDNGFFGLLFIYGGTGIVWLACLWARMIKSGWTIFKKKGLLTYILYPLYFLITGINEAHWYWQDGFMVLVLFLVIQQNEWVGCLSLKANTKK